MALKSFKPYTKTTRGTVIVDKSSLWKGSSYKSLTKGQHVTGGRIMLGELLQDIWVAAQNINLGL